MSRVSGVIGVLGLSGAALLIAVLTGCSPASANAPTAASSTPASGSTSPSAGSPDPVPTGTDPTPTPIPTIGDVSVILATYGVEADSVYASGIVPERVDQAGVCTLTARSGSETRSADLDAAPSPAAMNCGEIRITVPAGEWDVTLQYSSGDVSGSSETATVTVP